MSAGIREMEWMVCGWDGGDGGTGGGGWMRDILGQGAETEQWIRGEQLSGGRVCV